MFRLAGVTALSLVVALATGCEFDSSAPDDSEDARRLPDARTSVPDAEPAPVPDAEPAPVPDAATVSPPDAEPAPDARLNRAPTTRPVTVPTIPLSGRASVVLLGDDPDGDPITFELASLTSHGTLSGDLPNLVYMPDRGYSGTDSFAFTVSDGRLSSAPQTVTLTISPVAELPQALPALIDVRENESATFTLHATDTGSTDHRFAVVTAPRHGTVTLAGREATYAPNPGYSGTDAFTVQVTDAAGERHTEPAAITLRVVHVDHPPVANAQTVTVIEDGSAAFTLTGRDADGDAITYQLVSQPSHGRLAGTLPNLTYRPSDNYDAGDAFTFVATAAGRDSLPAVVTIAVTPVNDSPVAQPATIVAFEDTLISFPLVATDVDSATLTYHALGNTPRLGTATFAGNVVTYMPRRDVSGTDHMGFEVSDGARLAGAPITITIVPTNDAPDAVDDIAVTDAGRPVTIDVARNDVDRDSEDLAPSDVSAPAHGTAEITDDGQIVYTPAAGFSGSDSFTYTVSDPDGADGTATVYVGVGQFPAGVATQQIAGLGFERFEISRPSLSRDGRFIAFDSDAELVAEDRNGLSDVYLYDRATASLVLVTPLPEFVNGTSSHSSRISADGRKIAFISGSPYLVPGDTNQDYDVFVYDRITGAMERISVDSAEAQSNGSSYVAPDTVSISDDGSRVAFMSRATNLTPDDTNGRADVFVRDLVAGTTTRVNVGRDGTQATGNSAVPVVSGNGRFVAFASGNLVPEVSGGYWHLYVRDLDDGTLEHVGVSSSGMPANAGAFYPSFSADGRYVAFTSGATNLVDEASTPLWRAYVHDRQEHRTVLGAPATLAASSTSLSADGRYLVVQTAERSIHLSDLVAGLYRTLVDGTQSGVPALSADGRYVVLGSAYPLARNRPASRFDLYVMPSPL